MTKDDADELIRGITVLAEVFSETISEERALAYFQALSDLETADVKRALERAVRECHFFPKPAELREFAAGEVPDAGAMYAALIQAKRKAGWEHGAPPHGELLRLAIDRVGGWRACWLHSDEELWRRVRDVTPGVVAAARARGLPLALEGPVRKALPAATLKALPGGKPPEDAA